MNAKYSGRLELTWTNKDKRLLAHDDVSYEWVSPADYRVSEVRLLRDAGMVGVTEAELDRISSHRCSPRNASYARPGPDSGVIGPDSLQPVNP